MYEVLVPFLWYAVYVKCAYSTEPNVPVLLFVLSVGQHVTVSWKCISYLFTAVVYVCEVAQINESDDRRDFC